MTLIKTIELAHLSGEVALAIHWANYHILIGDYQKADKVIAKALRSTQNLPELWALLASCEIHEGKIEAAYQNAEHALLINNEFIYALEILGSIQIMKHEWSSAIVTYEKILLFALPESNWLRNLAYSYASTEDLNRAKSFYEKAVAIDPFSADVWVDLAGVYLKLGNKDLALSAYQNGLKYDWLNGDKRTEALRAIYQLTNA